MSTPYGISTSQGTNTNDNVRSLVIRPLSSNQYPGTIRYHSYGTLTGIRPNPPLFYPSQEPVNTDQNVNARHQYFRTAESAQTLATQREIEIAKANGGSFFDYSTHIKHSTTGHMNYIKPVDSSLHIQKLRAGAVGKSGYKVGLPVDAPYSTKNYCPSGQRSSLRRARSGGCTAPKKKGAIENNSLCNGRVCGWGSITRQTY